MRVGVDASCWLNQRGYGRHARALLRALLEQDVRNDYIFFVDSPAPPADLPPRAKVQLVGASRPAAQAASADGSRSLGDMWRMCRALSSPEIDLVLFPSVYSFVPVTSDARKIVFIHDVIPERYPEFAHPNAKARLFWDLKVKLAIAQADTIATVSDYSRAQIVEMFRLPKARVHVVGEAPDAVFRPSAQPHSADPGFVLYAGGFGPHKNVEMLVDAFASATKGTNLRLVLVGENESEVFHSSLPEIHRRIDRAGIADRVEFTGFVPDARLASLMSEAMVLVLPSMMEGYGLPAVEAAACGCPVIATRESPLPALLGEGGVYVNPNKPAELEQALRCVLTSTQMRRKMSVAGLEAAGKLSWNIAARQLMQVMA